jgi:magnesium transporter
VPADGGGAVEVLMGDERVAPPPDGAIRWIDVIGHSEDDLRLLQSKFGFHPLAIEDCLHFDQRPKLEEYGGYLFIVVHAFTCDGKDPVEVDPREVHAFLGERYLVTVHDAQVPAIEAIWRRLAGDAALGRRGSDFIYYLLVDATVDMNFDQIDAITDAIEEVEDAVLGNPGKEDLARMFRIKRTLVQMRKVLSPQRDVFAVLSKRGTERVTERTAFYFRDVYDHLVRINESIEAARDILGNTLDAYLSVVANRTNDIMKRLTIMSAVFLPLTFITGFFGQNFTKLPYGSIGMLIAMLCACVIVPLGLLIWFYRSRWF